MLNRPTARALREVGISAATCHRRTQRLFAEKPGREVHAMVDPRKVDRGVVDNAPLDF